MSMQPKSFGFFQAKEDLKQSKHMMRTMTKNQLKTQKTKEELVQQAKEKLHEMAQTLQIVNLNVNDNQDVDILLQLYEDHRSHSVSSNEDFEDDL